jgi:hypothetical protein
MNITPDAWELKSLLFAEGVTEHAINVQVHEGPEGYLSVQIIAASLEKLGAVLAVLSGPEELEDEHSLASRITSADRPGQWQYKLTLARYPSDMSLFFLATILLPWSDLAEVVSRLRE